MTERTYIDWAREINQRWICHGDLRDTAARWMDYLADTAPERLAVSARHAFLLVKASGRVCDPKPWFYAGLFSLATAEEQEAWLSQHPFTAAAVGRHGVAFLEGLTHQTVAGDTAHLLRRIQGALNETKASSQDGLKPVGKGRPSPRDS